MSRERTVTISGKKTTNVPAAVKNLGNVIQTLSAKFVWANNINTIKIDIAQTEIYFPVTKKHIVKQNTALDRCLGMGIPKTAYMPLYYNCLLL